MNEKVLDVAQAAIKYGVTIGTSVGIFSLEVLCIDKLVPFHGAAKVMSALSKVGQVGKFIGLPTLETGIFILGAPAIAGGIAAGNAVDNLITDLRGKSVYIEGYVH